MDSKVSQRIIDEVRQEKEATDPVAVLQEAATRNLKTQALKDLGRIAVISAGAGAGARGIYGLLNLVRRNVRTRKPTYPAVSPLPLPVPAKEDEEEEPELAKAAGWLGDFFKGNKATTPIGIPWYQPAAMVGGLAAGGLGWHLVDKILDKRRKEEVDSQVERERERFRGALVGQYDEPVKISSDEPMEKLAADLDALYDLCMEKQALFNPDTAGATLGTYGYYAVPASLMAGWFAYSAARKRQRKNVLKKALERRRRRAYATQPAEIHAVPVPVDVEEEAA